MAQARTSLNRVRTDHTGGLHHPEWLRALYQRYGEGAGAHREGSYDAIAERLFGQLDFDRFLLEYDSEAAGSFDAIRFIPKKTAVLGLVSNNGHTIESPDYLKQRLDEASRFLPVDQLAICPRCGLRNIAEDVQWAKLEVIQDVASQVWGSEPT